jgi:hypothetical protein
LAKAGDAGALAPASAGMELAIDVDLKPTELHFSAPHRSSFVWGFAAVTQLRPGDFTELDLALSSPGLFFGLPRDFFTVALHFGSEATTRVVFPNDPK